MLKCLGIFLGGTALGLIANSLFGDKPFEGRISQQTIEDIDVRKINEDNKNQLVSNDSVKLASLWNDQTTIIIAVRRAG